MMNNCFIDTSALFKRYIPEKGTEQIDELFNIAENVYISDLTITEIISNLKRKSEVTREIDNDLYLSVKKEFLSDISQGNIQTVSVDSEIIIRSLVFIDKNHITPIDSIQLASASYLNSEEKDIVFVCSDKKLAKLAEENKLTVLFI